MTESISARQLAVNALIPHKSSPVLALATASAPVNIALVKYWGKRNELLHLPTTSSLSVALSLKTTTSITQSFDKDLLYLNGQEISSSSNFYTRATDFLSLFRPSQDFFFKIESTNEVPTAAGLASSASGFAALVKALNLYFGWNLTPQQLSILSRLGSGSAARSVYPGFVEWHKGNKESGEDSYAKPILSSFKNLRFAVLLLTSEAKKIGSTEAMLRTTLTSPIYKSWTEEVEKDLKIVRKAIELSDFTSLGQAVEKNALFMHATMLTAWPPICYWNEQTIFALKAVWKAREQGLSIFCTMDAGPNVKIIYTAEQEKYVCSLFPSLWQIPIMWE